MIAVETDMEALQKDWNVSTTCVPEKYAHFAKVEQRAHKVVIRLQGTPSSDADIDSYLQDFDEILKAKKPFLALFDTSNIGVISLRDIKKQATFLRERDEYSRQYMKRAAIVVGSSFTKRMLRILFSIRTPACPLEIFDSMNEAKKYLSECTHVF